MVGKLPLGILYQIDRINVNIDFIEDRTQINNQIANILIADLGGLPLDSDFMGIF